MSKFERAGRDAGMTLPEVLIAVVVTGMLVAALATATTVILRQNDNSKGRLNNARSEQNVGLWMPSDLASAESVDTSPGASPCGSQCPPNVNVGGSNALMLTWTGSIPGATAPIPTRTTVSYRYVQVGDEWQVIRVQCLSVNSAPPTCEQVTMLHNADAPPPGQEFLAGATSPAWVMLVTLAIDPTAPDDGSSAVIPVDPTYYVKNGRRVTVTINGGGDIAGAGGGQDQMTLSAGGVNRETDLSTTNLSATPTFSATRSRCGGNFGLVVDTSGSIGSTNMASVRTGITGFINAFAGTPVKLQVVRFSSTATTLGSGSGWARYFDMLIEADVTELKSLVTALNSSGSTNYEDAMFRMFRNSDGTVQEVLPSTLIFFTDGVPTVSRLTGTSATAPVVAEFADSGLPAPGGGLFNQLGWNRANRIVRQFEVDMEKIIGVYVGSDVNGSSSWVTQGAGYHLENFLRGYYQTFDRGYHFDNPQRGYKPTWQYAGSGLTYQYAASGLTYQVAGSGITYEFAGSGMTYEFAGSGMTYEYANSGVVWEKKTSGAWGTITKSVYDSNNSTNDESDNYRARVTGTPGSWTSTTKTLYDKSNNVNDSTEGFRARATGGLGSWTSTTKALYDLSNSNNLETEGFRARATGTLGGWTSTTKALYDLSNATGDATDGFQTLVGTLGSWTNTSKTYYDLNNTVAGETDGYKTVTGSLGSWTNTTQAYYDLNNTTADDSLDGYRMTKVYAAPYSVWEATTEALYKANNTTSDNSDGWMATIDYSAPYTQWASVPQSAYDSGNSTPDALDGWRANNIYSSPYTLWEPTTQALYTTNNTVAGNSDGWDATKVYTEPFTAFENPTSTPRQNRAILKDMIAPSGPVPAMPPGGPYTNADQATFYELPNWSQFAGAMTTLALAECGGTVTLQTKVGSVNAGDPFTYQNSVDLKTATTSAQFRSGTFDYDLGGGGSKSVTITPLITSNLARYSPAGWTCKAAGADYPFVATPVDGGPWTKITLTVSPNNAVSCVNQVTVS